LTITRPQAIAPPAPRHDRGDRAREGRRQVFDPGRLVEEADVEFNGMIELDLLMCRG
jgi:hypothetical protein